MEMIWLRNNSKRLFYLLMLLSILIVASLINLETLNNLPTICIYKRFFDYDCWGGGLTRSIVSLYNGNIAEAIRYNWRVFIIAPILMFLYIQQIIKVIYKLKISRKMYQHQIKCH